MLPKKRYVLSWAWIVTQFILQGQARGCQIPKDPQNTAWAGWQVSRGGSRIREERKEGGFPTEFLPFLNLTMAKEPST